jgi:hypothetical protein
MAKILSWQGRIGRPGARPATVPAFAAFVFVGLLGLTASAATGGTCGDTTLSDQGKFCSATAQALLCACNSAARDDFFVSRAVCANEPEQPDRDECFDDAQATRTEDQDFCVEQHDWRLEACDVLGEDRYDPPFEGSLFDKDFTKLTKPNPYYPLGIGYHWEYRTTTEVNTVDIQNRTKLIDGVTCIVARDQVFEGGFLKEATNDWFAAKKNGDTWYCGEETGEYEVFNGDKPKLPELVNIDGSFKADRDGAQPGIIMLASPVKGDAYFEEFSPANAEDYAIVRSTNYSYGKNAVLDTNVPKALAQFLCSAGDCIVTDNISMLEPGIVEHKYYAKGIGNFLETGPGGEVVRLVSCNFDPRCSSLPK